MLFAYRRSLKKRRVLVLAVYLIGLFSFLGMATYFVFFQEKQSVIWFGKAVSIISALTLPFAVWHLILLFRGTGEWNIQISDTELIWQVPDNIGEKNFRIPIANISKIICEPPRHNSESSDWYYIETVNGEKYYLNQSASGINLNKLCNHLERMGVKYEIHRNP